MSTELILKGLEAIEVNQTEFRDRLNQLEQKGYTPPGEFTAKSGESVGEMVCKAFEQNRELFNKTRSVRLEVKAATDAITTASGRNIVSGGVGSPFDAGLGLQNAFKPRPASGVSALEYSRYLTQQGAAEVQAGEGAQKAAVRPDHALIQQSAITIAGYAKMSRQALNDSAELKAAIENTLLRSVGQTLGGVLANGSTAPVFDGYLALATGAPSLFYTNLADATSEGVATMQGTGFEPDVVALSAQEWLGLVTATGSDGQYLSGSYLGILPSELRGLRVVIAPQVPDDSSLLIDTRHCDLLTVDAFGVEIAYSGDDFVKNLVTLLGEIRVVPTMRATGAVRLVTRKV